MRLLIGVDPGLTTGLAAIDLDAEPDSPKLLAWEASPHSAIRWVHTWLDGGMAARVATERFVIPVGASKLSRQPDALEVIGALRYLCDEANPRVPFELQDRAARNRVSLTVLHDLGWSRLPGGTGHSRDALRHALLALVTHLPEHPLAARIASGTLGRTE
jgi:predicted RNase H-like nuclease (RuvC/YqgF family)